MKLLQNITEKFKRGGPTDLVGIDIKKDGIAAVRMRKNNEEASVISADILPPIELPADSSQGEKQTPPTPLILPAKLKARYASLAISCENAIVKLLSFPGHFDSAAEGKVMGSMGIEKPENFRVGYKVIQEGRGKSESKVLAAAIPETLAQSTVMLLPLGIPAPFSLEISGLAVMSAFAQAPAVPHKTDAVGAIHFEENITTFALFNKAVPALIKRFEAGSNTLLGKIQETLGVDKVTAQGILADGAFDISQAVSKVLEPIIKQILLSRDFVERRDNCHITKMYASGALAASHDSINEIKKYIGLDIDSWNPFDGLKMTPNAYPENLKGQEWQFSAAIGACLATFEEI